jgi:hypothetical protein
MVLLDNLILSYFIYSINIVNIFIVLVRLSMLPISGFDKLEGRFGTIEPCRTSCLFNGKRTIGGLTA